jgi:tetratricopeptide (TPR) repeat protein
VLIERELDVASVPAAFVDAIEELTGGNPLFVVECLRHLIDEGVLAPDSGTWPTDPTTMPLPETIDGIIETRLARLGDDELSVLQSAAVIGERVPLSVLATVTDRSEAELQEIASTFVEADLWTEVRAAELPLTRTFRFESAVARERVLETLSASDRRTRHESVAEALLSVNGQDEQDRHASVARQYERAGRIDSAIDHYQEAADHATDVYAHDCALASLERAHDLASEHDREATCSELLLEMAECWYLIGEYDRAAEQVKRVYDGTTDAELLQRALARLGKIAVAQGAFDRAIELAEEGIELTSGGEPTAVCRLLHVKCMAEWRQGQFETARETARRQHQLASEIEDRSLVADALHDLGTILLQQGAYEAAEGRFDEELSIRHELDDRHGVAKTLGNIGIVAQHQGDLEDTREYYERSLEGFSEVGSQYDVATVLNNLGTIALESGELDRAQVYLEESLECFRRLDIRDGIALVLTNIGNLARARGNVEAARSYHQDGLELARELGSRHLVAENVDGLGLLAAAEGDVHDARESFEESLAIKRDLGVTHGIAQTLADLGSVCLDMGAHDRARNHLEEAEQLAGQVGDPTLVADCRGQLGTLAVQEDDIQTASQWCEAAIEALEEAGTLGTDRAKPLDRLDELVSRAMDAGYDEAASDWCQRLTDLLDSRDDDVDEERFADPRARSLG